MMHARGFKGMVGGAHGALLTLHLLTTIPLFAEPLPILRDVEWQPFEAQVKRVIETLDYLGSPFTDFERNVDLFFRPNQRKNGSNRIAVMKHCLDVWQKRGSRVPAESKAEERSH